MAGEATPIAADDSGVVKTVSNPIPPVLRDNRTVEPQRYIVDGKEVEVTPDQIQMLVQKGLAADSRFQEAATMRKEAERAIALKEDLEAVIRDGDVDAFRRMGAAAGIPGNEVEAAAQKVWGDGFDDDEEAEGDDPIPSVGSSPRIANSQVDFTNLPKDVQRLLLIGEKARINEIVTAALDKSDKVSYNMKQFDEKGRTAIRQLVDEKIRGRLATTNGDFGDGSHILREILPEVEAMLEALGSPTRNVGPLGVGPAPGGDGIDVYPKKLPDHVPSTSGAFEQSILETLAFHHANAQRAEQS